MSNERYLHTGQEVKLTGRTATRTIGKEGTRKGTREDVQYEITPIDLSKGSWTAWVRMSELYIIQEPDGE